MEPPNGPPRKPEWPEGYGPPDTRPPTPPTVEPPPKRSNIFLRILASIGKTTGSCLLSLVVLALVVAAIAVPITIVVRLVSEHDRANQVTKNFCSAIASENAKHPNPQPPTTAKAWTSLITETDHSLTSVSSPSDIHQTVSEMTQAGQGFLHILNGSGPTLTPTQETRATVFLRFYGVEANTLANWTKAHC